MVTESPCHGFELLSLLAHCGDLHRGDTKCFAQLSLGWQNEAGVYFFCPWYSRRHCDFVQVRQEISLR